MPANKVLHVCAAEYSARTLLFPQLRYLRDRGYAVSLGCAPDGSAFAAETHEFSPIRLRLPRTPLPHRLALGLGDVVSTVRRQRPDLLHLHSPAAALAVRSLPRSVWPSGMRLAYTVHGFAHQWDRLDRRPDRLTESAERRLSRRADALLFQSREDMAQCQARGYGGRQVYLGNGVEDNWWQLAVAVRTRQPLRLLFVGRLVRQKGLLELTDAVAQVDGVHLTVVGGQLDSERDGVQAELLERAARPGLTGRVQLTGHLDKGAIAAQMAAHDCFVLPSYREGVPRSMLEAMAGGRPVVTTDIRGCRELVVDGVNGLLVPPRDTFALAGALRRVRDAPETEFGSWAVASRRAAEPHRESAVFGRLQQCYRSLGLEPA